MTHQRSSLSWEKGLIPQQLLSRSSCLSFLSLLNEFEQDQGPFEDVLQGMPLHHEFPFSWGHQCTAWFQRNPLSRSKLESFETFCNNLLMMIASHFQALYLKLVCVSCMGLLTKRWKALLRWQSEINNPDSSKKHHSVVWILLIQSQPHRAPSNWLLALNITITQTCNLINALICPPITVSIIILLNLY